MEINNDQQWKYFYRVGAISVFAAMFVMLTEMFITVLPDGTVTENTITFLLEMYQRNWFMAMRYMGLMNIFATSLMIPVFFALYGIHRKTSGVFAAFALIISLLSYVIFMADNVSFPILHLSQKYSPSNTESEKMIIIAAVEALFAKGASHTPGTFPGFFIGEIGSILFCIVMIIGNVFKKITGIIGLVAFTFLLIFEIMSSFINRFSNIAMIFVMIGGISALTWYVLIGLELIKASKRNA
jgi:hypothetical protein